ncbi:MAG: PBP1A family penicillin-binding protein [Nitrospirota bacterium]
MRVKKLTILVLLVIVLPLSVGLAAGGFFAFVRTVPSIEELKQQKAPPSTRIYADDDTIIGELKVQKGIYVPLGRMPQELLDAVVAVEDSKFWKHEGLDYMAIVRAAMKDIMERHLKEGASTITQQLAKITFLTPEKTIKRKLREAILATRIEKNLSKGEILELYLNRVYFGHGAYGVEMASRTYFDKSVSDIGLPEAALLAGLLKAPNSYSPFRSFERAKTRQRVVLARMEEEGLINRKQRIEAVQSPIYLSSARTGRETNNYFIEYVRSYLEDRYGADAVYKGGMRVYTTMNRHAQFAAHLALQRGLRALDKRRGFRGPVEHREISVEEELEAKGSFRSIPPDVGSIVQGLVLKVSRREALVKASGLVGKLPVEDARWARLRWDEKKRETREIRNFSLEKILKPGDVITVLVKSINGGRPLFALEQEPEAQGALVALEPGTGFIRAIVGGYDYRRSEFNRALYARRQPGSAFKPIVFATALQNDFTPASIIDDAFVAFQKTLDGPVPNPDPEYDPLEDPDFDPEDYWVPENYDDEYHGPTRLREALAQSRNVVSVKLVDKVGYRNVISLARAMGIKDDLPRNLTIALGTMTVTPLDLTSAYGVFANGGVQMKPIGIKYIIDRRGSVVENNEPRGKRVLDEQTAFLINSMLQDVVSHGTGWRARALRRPVAGKTGTTNEYRDAWFLGYTMDMMAGVWVGYDDMSPLGEDETGSRAAAPVWVDFMKTVSANYEPKEFPVPEGITTRIIDRETGLLANRWTDDPLLEYFKEGTEPREVAPTIWQTIEPDSLIFDPDM